MAAEHPNKLGLPHEAAPITIHGNDCHWIGHVAESRKLAMWLQYMDNLALGHEPEVQVSQINPYNLELG